MISLVYLCAITTHRFTLQPHEVLEAAWHDVDDDIEWHLNHELLARGARDAWWRPRAGL